MYDVIIVGGGAAGLSAALLLGRALRNVLLCDAGKPRNARAVSFNGYLSRDGSTPAEFQRICRRQLTRYSNVRRIRAIVSRVERAGSNFAVRLRGGKTVRGKMILLATGLVDEVPRVKGLARLYGKSVHSCPYCHGWECRGKNLGVIGNDKAAVDLCLEVRLWSPSTVLLPNGGAVSKWHAARLTKSGIRIIPGAIRALESTKGALSRVRLKSGQSHALDAVFVSPNQHQRCPVAEALGCRFCEKDGCIECDESAFTGIPGVYAAGNAAKGIQLVVMAAAEGAAAAVAINNALLERDLKTS